ncbi:MAG: hypothetical protein JRN19_00965 [Nitrososphaerota archaeon]|nr:hypothetical protein [Nitrososphaerota archaeon]MDG7051017.1 hypothetical protein [Nitrososphaerota archaeon]
MNIYLLTDVLIIVVAVIEIFIGIYLINIFRVPNDIIKLLRNDVDITIKKQNQVIADLMVKVDILLKRERNYPVINSSSDNISTQATSEVITTNESGSLSIQILELLKKGALTSVQVQSIIKKSREHTARELKRMTELGLVERDITKRPFIYKITNKGLESIT